MPFSVPFSREYVGTTMAQPLSLPSSARSKSSEKSSSFFFAIGSVGMEGSFGASTAKLVAVTRQASVRKAVIEANPFSGVLRRKGRRRELPDLSFS